MRKILLIAAACAAPAPADPGPPVPAVADIEQARIPFPGFRIRSFYAPTDRTVYIQDQSREWYRAEILGLCRGLSFAHVLGLDTRGSSSFDRFSAILVEGDRCQLGSLTRSTAPERRKHKKRSA
jgi:hypothetical protein